MASAAAFWLMSILGLVLVAGSLLWLIQYHVKQITPPEKIN
jgi:hypothetical protein